MRWQQNTFQMASKYCLVRYEFEHMHAYAYMYINILYNTNHVRMRNITPETLCRFLAGWSRTFCRGWSKIHVHLLWWIKGETHQSNIILKGIYIYTYVWYTILISFIRAMLFSFGWLHDQGCCSKISHCTREFTLVAKWTNSFEWHMMQ